MSNITIYGLDELEKKLGRLASIEILKPPMHKSTKLIQSEAQIYPPPRSGQTYVRTSNLANRWVERVEVRGKTLVGIISNNVSYGKWVQHPQYQAWMHRGRWPTTDDITKKVAKTIGIIFEKAIRKAINE